MRSRRSLISLLAAGALVAVGATPSSAATESDERRGRYAGYTAEVAEPSMIDGILQVPYWRECDLFQTKAITSTLGVLSPTGGQALLKVDSYCSPEFGHVALGYLHTGSDEHELSWDIRQRDRIRLEVDVDAGIIRASNLDRSESDEYGLPASFAADRLVAQSRVTAPEAGHRFTANRFTNVTVDGVSLAQLHPTKLKQVYLGEVIAHPSEIDDGGDFSIRPGAG